MKRSAKSTIEVTLRVQASRLRTRLKSRHARITALLGEVREIQIELYTTQKKIDELAKID